MSEPTMLEQLLAAMEDAKAVIRQAHEVTKDLRQAMKEARELARELQREEFDPFLRKLVEEAAEQIRTAARRDIERASREVIAKFDQLSNLLMHGNKQGRGEGLEAAIHRIAAERHPDGRMR